jgi:hypothetical protein
MEGYMFRFMQIDGRLEAGLAGVELLCFCTWLLFEKGGPCKEISQGPLVRRSSLYPGLCSCREILGAAPSQKS